MTTTRSLREVTDDLLVMHEVIRRFGLSGYCKQKIECPRCKNSSKGELNVLSCNWCSGTGKSFERILQYWIVENERLNGILK